MEIVAVERKWKQNWKLYLPKIKRRKYVTKKNTKDKFLVKIANLIIL